jgi:hypothetical protein
MEIRPHNNIRYLPTLDRHEPLVMDATAMTTFMTCPRKFLYRIVFGAVPKLIMPYFNFGSSYHKFREVIEAEHLDGVSPIIAYKHAQEAAVATFKKGGGNPSTNTKWDFMTEVRLIESMEYVFTKTWLPEKASKRIEVLMVEQPFLLEMEDGTIRAGRADQIVKWNGKVWGRDFKTTSKTGMFYDRTLEPNDQFTGYTWGEGKLVGEHVQGQMVEVLFNAKKPETTRKGSKAKYGPEVLNYTTSRTKTQLQVWEKEHAFWMKFIEQCRENDIWPMNTKSCPYCEYRNVCTAPTETGQLNTLKTQYAFKPWDCTKVEQDDE